MRQVHGADVHVLKALPGSSTGKMSILGPCDALATRLDNVWLVVQTADCIPLLIYDPEVYMAAAVHVGWRSAEANIVEKVIDKIGRVFGSRPENIRAALGPGICRHCFEVGEEVIHRFDPLIEKSESLRLIRTKGEKYLFDIKGFIIVELQRQGVPLNQIEDLERCTVCEELFYSYRRDRCLERLYAGIILSPGKGLRGRKGAH